VSAQHVQGPGFNSPALLKQKEEKKNNNKKPNKMVRRMNGVNATSSIL
jgi:hypothetical protein